MWKVSLWRRIFWCPHARDRAARFRLDRRRVSLTCLWNRFMAMAGPTTPSKPHEYRTDGHWISALLPPIHTPPPSSPLSAASHIPTQQPSSMRTRLQPVNSASPSTQASSRTAASTTLRPEAPRTRSIATLDMGAGRAPMRAQSQTIRPADATPHR